MKLVVISEPDRAKELLKTNIEVKVGQKFGGDETSMRALAYANPKVFKLEGDELEEAQKKMDQKRSHSPKKNKKMDKGDKFKSKD